MPGSNSVVESSLCQTKHPALVESRSLRGISRYRKPESLRLSSGTVHNDCDWIDHLSSRTSGQYPFARQQTHQIKRLALLLISTMYARSWDSSIRPPRNTNKVSVSKLETVRSYPPLFQLTGNLPMQESLGLWHNKFRISAQVPNFELVQDDGHRAFSNRITYHDPKKVENPSIRLSRICLTMYLRSTKGKRWWFTVSWLRIHCTLAYTAPWR